jgi:hypothetical protein
MEAETKMNHKGSSVLFLIFELILVCAIVGSALYWAHQMATSDGHEQIMITNEIKLMVEMLASSAGDAEVALPYSTEKYILTLTSSSINIKKPKEKGVTREFILPSAIVEASGFEEQQKSLCLKKEGNNILLDICPIKKLSSAEAET